MRYSGQRHKLVNRHQLSNTTRLKASSVNDGCSCEPQQSFRQLQQAVRAPPVLWCLLTWSLHA